MSLSLSHISQILRERALASPPSPRSLPGFFHWLSEPSTETVQSHFVPPSAAPISCHHACERARTIARSTKPKHQHTQALQLWSAISRRFASAVSRFLTFLLEAAHPLARHRSTLLDTQTDTQHVLEGLASLAPPKRASSSLHYRPLAPKHAHGVDAVTSPALYRTVRPMTRIETPNGLLVSALQITASKTRERRQVAHSSVLSVQIFIIRTAAMPGAG